MSDHFNHTGERCKYTDCKTCLAKHAALADELRKKTGVTRTDHLMNYRKWWDEQGIESETEYGWAEPFIFEQENIDRFMDEYWGIK